jgi:hypothetical protein
MREHVVDEPRMRTNWAANRLPDPHYPVGDVTSREKRLGLVTCLHGLRDHP